MDGITQNAIQDGRLSKSTATLDNKAKGVEIRYTVFK
jgi:hypothetical protein